MQIRCLHLSTHFILINEIHREGCLFIVVDAGGQFPRSHSQSNLEPGLRFSSLVFSSLCKVIAI